MLRSSLFAHAGMLMDLVLMRARSTAPLGTPPTPIDGYSMRDTVRITADGVGRMCAVQAGGGGPNQSEENAKSYFYGATSQKS